MMVLDNFYLLYAYGNSVIRRSVTNVDFSLDRVRIFWLAGADVICFGVLVVDGYLFFYQIIWNYN